MKVAIVGSRNYCDAPSVIKYVNSLPRETVVISGGALGPDRISVTAAKKIGLETIVLDANWAAYGKAAGVRRNKEIVDLADKIVCFWDGVSHGTKNDIELAIEAKKPLEVFAARIYSTRFCASCTFWLDFIEHGKWIRKKVVWHGIGYASCCGHKVVYDGIQEWYENEDEEKDKDE